MTARVINLVGPKGYIHGWIHVGAPGAGDRVMHPGLGTGTVTSHDGGHVRVKFDGGGERTFETRGGKGPGRLEKRAPAAPRTAAPRAPAASPGKLLDQYKGWRDGLTPKEDKAMRFYQSPGFALMNGQLRGLDGGKLAASEHASESDLTRARQASRDLTKAIAKAPPLPHDVTVYRGFDASQFGKLTAGQVITDKGFTSTSITNDAGAVGRAGSKGQSEIILPEGTRAAAGSARELVLPPGSSFRVVSVRTAGGVTHLKLELIPKGTEHANDSEAVELATRTPMPRIRGAADAQVTRTGPGAVSVTHRSTGRKVGTLAKGDGGWQATHVTGKKTAPAPSMAAAMNGLIGMHNKIAAAPSSSVTYTADAGPSVDLATPAVTSSDGPRVTSMGGAGKPAKGAKPAADGASAEVKMIYAKLIKKGMKPTQAMALAKRAAAMHARASAKKAA